MFLCVKLVSQQRQAHLPRATQQKHISSLWTPWTKTAQRDPRFGKGATHREAVDEVGVTQTTLHSVHGMHAGSWTKITLAGIVNSNRNESAQMPKGQVVRGASTNKAKKRCVEAERRRVTDRTRTRYHTGHTRTQRCGGDSQGKG